MKLSQRTKSFSSCFQDKPDELTRINRRNQSCNVWMASDYSFII